MLIVISDLHLQHTSADVFRYKGVHGEERECGVHRNISPEALTLLKDEVIRYRQKFQNHEVKLVLNGDIFEILRTPIWFERQMRPYHEGLPPEALKPVVLEIMNAIEADNQDFFTTLRQYFVHKKDENGQPISAFDGLSIQIVYLPGNHDRLINAWPETRRRARELLGIPLSDEAFPHTVTLTLEDKKEPYGALIRHGHEYDKFNFVAAMPGETLEHRYLRSPLGDVLAVEVGAALAYNFRKRYEKAMQDAKGGEAYRKLYLALVDFDDVRPDITTFSYLTFALEKIKSEHGTNLDDEVASLMRPIIFDACCAIMPNPFFRRPGTPLWAKLVTSPIACAAILWLLQFLPPSALVWTLKTILTLKSFAETAPPAQHASEEELLKKNAVDIVVAGHTHHHDQVPIAAKASGTSYFLDTGTWRTLIYDGTGTVFGHLKSLTYVTLHKRQEMRSGRRFDTWTGHLASSSYGAYDQVAGQGTVFESKKKVA